MDDFTYRNGLLHAEDVPVEELAQRFGTPLYVYSRSHLVRQYRALADAMKEVDPLIFFAVKSNTNAAVIDTLAQFAPNIRDAILHRQVLTAWDMEQIFGLTEGNIFHGELSLHQLFFLRPVPAWANYRTPIQGLYQCGSGTHPGGGIAGFRSRA